MGKLTGLATSNQVALGSLGRVSLEDARCETLRRSVAPSGMIRRVGRGVNARTLHRSLWNDPSEGSKEAKRTSELENLQALRRLTGRAGQFEPHFVVRSKDALLPHRKLSRGDNRYADARERGRSLGETLGRDFADSYLKFNAPLKLNVSPAGASVW